nr:hypothetical protein [uncultured Campylobacter sp.]
MREAYAVKAWIYAVNWTKRAKSALEQTLKSKGANEQEFKVNF